MKPTKAGPRSSRRPRDIEEFVAAGGSSIHTPPSSPPMANASSPTLRMSRTARRRQPPSIQPSFEARRHYRAPSQKRPFDRNCPSHFEIRRHPNVMNFPVAIEHEANRAYGVQFPDVPGCFSAGDTLDEALANAAEGLAFHIEGLLDAGEHIPVPLDLESHSHKPEFSGMIWALVPVDLASLSGKSRRLNISLPERVVRRIDAAALKNGESRSAFLARVALESV